MFMRVGPFLTCRDGGLPAQPRLSVAIRTINAWISAMRHPRAQNLWQMALVERNQMVKTFATRGADRTLTERVRLWHTGRRLQDPKIHGPQGPVNRR